MIKKYLLLFFISLLLCGCESVSLESSSAISIDTSNGCEFAKSDLASWWSTSEKKYFDTVKDYIGVKKAVWSGECNDGFANGDGVLTVKMKNDNTYVFKGFMANGHFRGAVQLTTTYGYNFRDGINYFYDGKHFKTEKQFSERIEAIPAAKNTCDKIPSNSGRAKKKPGYIETFSWTGNCKNGYADGNGLLQWYVDGHPREKYEGEIKEGRYDGQGTITWPNGKQDKGMWKRGQLAGFGEEIIPKKVAEESTKKYTNGKWVGENYIISGYYSYGFFQFSCENIIECEKENQRRIIEEAHAAAAKSTQAEYYQRKNSANATGSYSCKFRCRTNGINGWYKDEMTLQVNGNNQSSAASNANAAAKKICGQYRKDNGEIMFPTELTCK